MSTTRCPRLRNARAWISGLAKSAHRRKRLERQRLPPVVTLQNRGFRRAHAHQLSFRQTTECRHLRWSTFTRNSPIPCHSPTSFSRSASVRRRPRVPGLGKLRSGVLSDDQISGFRGDRGHDLSAVFFDELLGFLPAERGESAGNDKGLAGQCPRPAACSAGESATCRPAALQPPDQVTGFLPLRNSPERCGRSSGPMPWTEEISSSDAASSGHLRCRRPQPASSAMLSPTCRIPRANSTRLKGRALL